MKIMNGGLDPDLFCVTDDMDAARAFYARGTGGTVHLTTTWTASLCCALDEFNRAGLNGNSPQAKTLKAEMNELTRSVVPYDFRIFLHKTQEKYGWRDSPHSHTHITALLTGFEDRPTEIASGPLVHPESLAQGDVLWGLSGSEATKGFGASAPISFAERGLTILLPARDNRDSVMHRLPQKLHHSEKRGYILVGRRYV